MAIQRFRFPGGRAAVAAVAIAAVWLAVNTARADDSVLTAANISQSSQSAADAASGGTLQEVVVSAQKRSEDVQNVPISITAISGDQLQAERIESFDDLTRTIPGVNFNSVSGTEGTSNIEIRGVSST